MASVADTGERRQTFWASAKPSATHPGWMPPADRKEVFFDRYHDRGEEWYAGLFSGSNKYRASGEITPTYFGNTKALERMKTFNQDMKLIIILRNPVDRAISHYRMEVENARINGSFESAIEKNTNLRHYSYYRKHLEEIGDKFSKQNVFLMIYEELFANAEATSEHLSALGSFLDIDRELLQQLMLVDRVRASKGAPRWPWLVRRAKRIRRKLMDSDLEWAVDAAKRVGFSRNLIVKESRTVPVAEAERGRFRALFQEDVLATESYVGRSIAAWQQ